MPSPSFPSPHAEAVNVLRGEEIEAKEDKEHEVVVEVGAAMSYSTGNHASDDNHLQPTRQENEDTKTPWWRNWKLGMLGSRKSATKAVPKTTSLLAISTNNHKTLKVSDLPSPVASSTPVSNSRKRKSDVSTDMNSDTHLLPFSPPPSSDHQTGNHRSDMWRQDHQKPAKCPRYMNSIRLKEKEVYRQILNNHIKNPLRHTTLVTTKEPTRTSYTTPYGTFTSNAPGTSGSAFRKIIITDPKEKESLTERIKQFSVRQKQKSMQETIAKEPSVQPDLNCSTSSSVIEVEPKETTNFKNPFILQLPTSYTAYRAEKEKPEASKFFTNKWIIDLKNSVPETNDVATILRVEAEYREQKKDREDAQQKKDEVMRRMGPVRSEIGTQYHYEKYVYAETEEDGVEEEEGEQEKEELTDEMSVRINEALVIKGKDEEEILDGGNLRRKDMQTLTGLNWLNDEVINEYFQLIQKRSASATTNTTSSYPRTHCFNTFFYSRLKDKGFAGVKRWTKKVDIFSYELVLIPLHLGMHWTLASIHMPKRLVTYYDSMNGGGKEPLAIITEYLREESLDKRKIDINQDLVDHWVVTQNKEIPQQQNGSDCGMFTCKYGEAIARGLSNFPFTQARMPFYRKRMIWELLEKTLLS